MDFLEKTLEQIIFETDRDLLSDRGIYLINHGFKIKSKS